MAGSRSDGAHLRGPTGASSPAKPDLRAAQARPRAPLAYRAEPESSYTDDLADRADGAPCHPLMFGTDAIRLDQRTAPGVAWDYVWRLSPATKGD